MEYFANGVCGFNTEADMFYDLFNELGLAIGNDQYLYIQDTGSQLNLNGKFIKASINGSVIYAGRNDIVFDPRHNFTLIKKLFGFYIDQCTNSEDGDALGIYIADYVEDDAAKEKQRVVVRTRDRGDIGSNYYYNIYLAYIDCIFKIGGYNVDLSNFDYIEEEK